MLVWSTWHKQVRTLPASNPMCEISHRFCRHFDHRVNAKRPTSPQSGQVDADYSSGGNTVLEVSLHFLSSLVPFTLERSRLVREETLTRDFNEEERWVAT